MEIKNFIAEYLRLSEHLESPTSYLKWGAISCLSAALRDNVYLANEYRLTRTYPNMYILLLGDTSLVRKSGPITINKSLLRGARGLNNTKLIAGATTVPAILKMLANSTSKGPQNGSGYLLASELSAFFIKDDTTIGHLTDLYDYHELYDKHLATTEIPPIPKLCLGLFGGTNEAMMKKLIDSTAKEGGFIGRCIVINEKERRLKNSGYEKDVNYSNENDWFEQVKFLQKLDKIQGPVTLDEETKEAYNSFYHKFEFRDHYTKTGFEGRLHTHIEKTMIAIASSRHDFDRVIHLNDFLEAHDLCYSLMSEYKRLTYGEGIDPDKDALKLILNALMEAPRRYLSRMQLLVQMHGNVPGDKLDIIMQTLVEKQFVQCQSKAGYPGWFLTDFFLHEIGYGHSNNGTGKSKFTTN